jgi:hypothetical protein
LRAGLKDVALAQPHHRPGGLVLDQDHRRSGRQRCPEELVIRLGKTAPLDSEVGHPSDHQLVLDLVMHVMQDDLLVAVQQFGGNALAEAHRIDGSLRVALALHR